MTSKIIVEPVAKNTFETTRWTLIDDLRHADPAVRSHALDELSRTYRPAMVTFYRSMGLTADTADDLTQDFLAKKVLDGDLFLKADQSRARLRALIKAALRNYRIDVLRKACLPPPASLLAEPPADETLAAQYNAAFREFDRTWATQLLHQAVERCRQYYDRSDRTSDWEAFDLRVLSPIRTGNTPPSVSDIAKRVGKPTAAAVSHAIYEVKQRLKTELIAAVAMTVVDADCVETELADIRTYLVF